MVRPKENPKLFRQVSRYSRSLKPELPGRIRRRRVLRFEKGIEPYVEVRERIIKHLCERGISVIWFVPYTALASHFLEAALNGDGRPPTSDLERQLNEEMAGEIWRIALDVAEDFKGE